MPAVLKSKWTKINSEDADYYKYTRLILLFLVATDIIRYVGPRSTKIMLTATVFDVCDKEKC